MQLDLSIERETTDSEWNAVPSRFTRHYRSGNYTRPKTSRSGKSGVKATLLELPICAIDGEGKTRHRAPTSRACKRSTCDCPHDYTLFCASWDDGTPFGSRRLIEGVNLRTEQILEFLLDLPEHHTYVGYGLSYDTNMWLRYLPRKIIGLLLDTGKALWKHYRLQWIERKFFRVSRGKRSVTVYDVLANWQVTFVKACQDWGIGDPETLAIVQAMKDKRGLFDAVEDGEIRDYCYLECDLLRQLCRKLFDAILRTPYRPNAVYGPGALARAALMKEGVQRHMAQLPEELQTIARTAYFGGRFDCAVFGWFTDLYQYDIKSAYPDQIRYLPCLKHAEWRYVSQQLNGEIIPAEYGMYRVEWSLPSDTAWTPFPHRRSDGCVFYPYEAEGWYHGSEINAAMALHGNAIRVIEGYDLIRGCEHRPFEFVDSLFALRKKLESEGGHDQGNVIKLIMNSLYGKLAQQVGSKNGKPPRFQCFYWAGAITAGTRAKILRNLAESPTDVIGIATDSLVSLRNLDLEFGSNLGQWDAKHLTHFAQISNGVSNGFTDSGHEIDRGRGIGRYALDWESVRRDWLASKGCGYHKFTAKSRFITLREARKSLERDAIECRWIARERRINFYPQRRFPGKLPTRKDPTMRLEPLAPEDYNADRASQPFRLKTAWKEVHEERENWFDHSWRDNE